MGSYLLQTVRFPWEPILPRVQPISNVWKNGLKGLQSAPEITHSGNVCRIGTFWSLFNQLFGQGSTITLEEKIHGNPNDFKKIVGLAHKSFKESYQKSQSNNSFHHFEFWIGGYDFQIQNGEIWKFEIK